MASTRNAKSTIFPKNTYPQTLPPYYPVPQLSGIETTSKDLED